jgi:hypothetical protein
MVRRWCSVAIAAVVLTAGCTSTRATSQNLERVAKDWALTIRASQVIPVYPLTEDVQVGDVFLVRSRIEDQVKLYEERGFLPLDNLVVRLRPTGYEAFYWDGYKTKGRYQDIPHHWQFGEHGADWQSAPRAAFPTYQFAVRRGQGASIAVPVQGVPVGLNLMNASSANGTITIADAFTYGLNIEALLTDLQTWATAKRAFLRSFEPFSAPKTKRPERTFLRVVSRVFLTGRVTISLINDTTTAGGANVASAPPSPLLNPAGSAEALAAAQNYAATMEALNKSIPASSTPGVGIKFAAATSRAVTMEETFPRPLVIGYTAFDVPIDAGGALGAPMATLARLEREQGATTYAPDANTSVLKQWIADPDHRDKVKAFLVTRGTDPDLLPNILFSDKYASLRAEIVRHFDIN